METTTYNLIREYGTINKRVDQLGNKWDKKVTLCSWNGKAALFDVREWSEDGNTCRSGMRLNESELYRLGDLIAEIREERHGNRAAD